MADVSIEAVQSALEDTQRSLADLELACELQRAEFFADETSVSSSSGDPLDELEDNKQALQLQVGADTLDWQLQGCWIRMQARRRAGDGARLWRLWRMCGLPRQLPLLRR